MKVETAQTPQEGIDDLIDLLNKLSDEECDELNVLQVLELGFCVTRFMDDIKRIFYGETTETSEDAN